MQGKPGIMILFRDIPKKYCIGSNYIVQSFIGYFYINSEVVMNSLNMVSNHAFVFIELFTNWAISVLWYNKST